MRFFNCLFASANIYNNKCYRKKMIWKKVQLNTIQGNKKKVHSLKVRIIDEEA